jgi:RimJ/RimL family protein N-acetyltransferase
MTKKALEEFISLALEERQRGSSYPFVVYDKEKMAAAGSTRYGNISWKDKRIEIGWTWLGVDFQRTGLNRACKHALLKYAFETLDMERVEFKTDVSNQQARRALLKIGAKEEGILRSHSVMQDGRRRDTIYYSMLKNEWPGVRYPGIPRILPTWWSSRSFFL